MLLSRFSLVICYIHSSCICQSQVKSCFRKGKKKSYWFRNNTAHFLLHLGTTAQILFLVCKNSGRFSVGDLACDNLGICLHYLNVEKDSNQLVWWFSSSYSDKQKKKKSKFMTLGKEITWNYFILNCINILGIACITDIILITMGCDNKSMRGFIVWFSEVYLFIFFFMLSLLLWILKGMK